MFLVFMWKFLLLLSLLLVLLVDLLLRLFSGCCNLAATILPTPIRPYSLPATSTYAIENLGLHS